VQSNITAVGAGKKKCKENVSVIIPEVVDEVLPDTIVAADDDIASVHTSRVHHAVDDSSVMTEV